MKIKTTLGWVVENFKKCIRVSRLEMTYASTIGKPIKKGWWKTEYEKVPLDSDMEYASIMVGFHPWNELQGIFNASQLFPPETEIEISVVLAGRMNALLKREK